MKDSFILYTEQKEIIDKLTDEQAGKLIKAIYEYVATDKMPELEMTIDLIITPFKIALDKNKEKYQNVIERNRENGLKGGRPKKPKKPTGLFENPKKPKKADNEYDNDNEDENHIYTLSEAKASSSDTAKASKHKYGEYKHVLLKDEELQALKKDYANWEELIKYLDEYIEMKGYKAKSHYLAIRKWVVDAVKRNNAKTTENNSNKYIQDENKQYQDLSKFYANL